MYSEYQVDIKNGGRATIIAPQAVFAIEFIIPDLIGYSMAIGTFYADPYLTERNIMCINNNLIINYGKGKLKFQNINHLEKDIISGVFGQRGAFSISSKEMLGVVRAISC